MMSFKNSIVLTTVFLLNLVSSCNLHAQQPTFTYSMPFIWANDQNSSSNQFLNLPTAINRQQGFNNFQNNLNQIFSQCHKINCKKYLLLGLPYDCRLIEKICADNPHYDQHTLVTKLAHNETINSMYSYYNKINKHLGLLGENIIIDPEHFKDLPQADKRANDFLHAAHGAMKKRHNKELDTLKSTYNKAKKHLSKNEKASLKTQYQTDQAHLKKEHAQQEQDGSFITAQKKVQANCKKQHQNKMLHSMLDQHEKLIQQPGHQSSQSHEFVQTMQTRDQAIHASLKNPVATAKNHPLPDQTAGYLQAHNINPQIFATTNGLEIQHQFTQELVCVLDSVANFALQHPQASLHNNLALHCVNLASLTQQSNSVENLICVEQGVNSCHGIDHFIQGISSTDTIIRDQQMAIALDYCSAVARGAMQGVGTAIAISAATTLGMALAPTATGVILGAAAVATAVHIGTLCGQALMHAYTLGNYCVHGDYDKVDEFLQKTYQSITNLENIECATAYATGFITAYKGLPALQNLQKSFDMHPIIATIEQASGQVSRSLWFLTAAQVEEELIATQQILQRPEFQNFNLTCQEILGFKIFNLRPPCDPKLAPLLQLADMHGLIGPKDQVTLGQIFMSSNLAGNNALQGTISSVFSGSDSEFFTTELGKKMYAAMTKPHEQKKLIEIAKDYQKLQNNNTPERELHAFYKSHEILTIALENQPRSHITHLEYPGIENNIEHPHLTMYFQHIFYPEIKPILNDTNNGIQEFRLQGFHHDQYGALEKSGLFTYINPIYGDAAYGAEECIAAYLDFDHGIRPTELKTFFPQSWSREKTVEVIFYAAQNIIKELKTTSKNQSQKKFLCKGPNNLLIEIMIDTKNIIKSAYPSKQNFKKLKGIEI